MNGPTRLLVPLVAALAVSACNAGGTNSTLPQAGQGGATTTQGAARQLPGRRACNDFRTGYMHCDVLIQSQGISPNVAGWGPADFQTRYNLPSTTKGSGQIVAIVDAFDNPNVESDLATYRSNFGLGTANFTKYNQRGQTSNYPVGNTGWGVEIDLDVQMVSAVCPNCTIYLIEADDNRGRSLNAAEREAVKLGAHVISNSWGGGAGGSNASFRAKGVTYLASAGDSGYGMQDPADFDTVVSVGGTVITKTGSTYGEHVWSFSGAGCSVIPKPAWQHDPKCTFRTGNDVSAVADNVAVYDTYGNSGWGTVGGTSVSSPMLGGVFGLAGNGSSRQSGKAFWTLSHRKLKKDLNYISSGTVTHCPTSLTGTYLCTAGTGEYKTYSAPAGWGTPDGIGAF